jgi:hypothetical protein
LSGAGEVAQRSQIGASHVPLSRAGTFQSQSSVAGRPQAQRLVGRRLPQTMALPPPGIETRSHAIR